MQLQIENKRGVRRIRILLSLCLLTLFTAYQLDIAIFTHVHYVDGVMMSHAHPYKGKHTHSQAEMVVIASLSVDQILGPTAHFNLEPLRPLLSFLLVWNEIPLVKGTHFRVLSLRAPPAYIA